MCTGPSGLIPVIVVVGVSGTGAASVLVAHYTLGVGHRSPDTRHQAGDRGIGLPCRANCRMIRVLLSSGTAGDPLPPGAANPRTNRKRSNTNRVRVSRRWPGPNPASRDTGRIRWISVAEPGWQRPTAPPADPAGPFRPPVLGAVSWCAHLPADGLASGIGASGSPDQAVGLSGQADRSGLRGSGTRAPGSGSPCALDRSCSGGWIPPTDLGLLVGTSIAACPGSSAYRAGCTGSIGADRRADGGRVSRGLGCLHGSPHQAWVSVAAHAGVSGFVWIRLDTEPETTPQQPGPGPIGVSTLAKWLQRIGSARHGCVGLWVVPSALGPCPYDRCRRDATPIY